MDKVFVGAIQARMGSSRLPGKVMLPLLGKPVLHHVVNRVLASNCSEVIVVTSTDKQDDTIEAFCNEHNIKCFRGSEQDVLNRFFMAVRGRKGAVIVRITADNPFVGPDVINHMISEHVKHKNAVTTGYFSKSFPHGTVVTLIDYEALECMDKICKESLQREHIVFGFQKLPKEYRVEHAIAPKVWNKPYIRYTLDVPEDYELLVRVAAGLGLEGNKPTTAEIIEFIEAHKNIKQINWKFAKELY
jgi:spore coat polysaccharide biosynthesis protein SpsF